MISKLKCEHLLLLIAIVFALFISYTIQLNARFSSTGDDSSYLYSAKLLYSEFKLDNTRPLLISAIHGLPYLFDGSDKTIINWGFFLNFSCWFLTDLLLFRMLSFRLGRKKAFYLSLLFIFCVGNLAINYNFLSESIFIFMIVLSVYCVDKYYQTLAHHYITLAISILLFNALIKPVSIGLALIFIAFFILKLKKIVFNRYAFLLLISCILIVVQMFSLKKKYGDFTISYIGSITYYNYLGAKSDCYKKGIEYVPGENERTKAFTLLSSHEMKQKATEDFVDQLKNNTLNLSKAYLFCLYKNSSKGSYIVSECKNNDETSFFDFFYFLFKAIAKLQNIIFTIVSVVTSFYLLFHFKKTEKFYVLISLSILYIFFISGISSFQCDRFHIAFFPLFILQLSIYKWRIIQNNAKKTDSFCL
jgi:hypothetical protein